MSAKQTAETFWARVDVRGEDDCWNWTGSCNSTGYGNVGWDGGHYTAHRVAAFLSGLVAAPWAPEHGATTFVLHTCDNRRCCNPRHLELGSYSKNQADAYARKRRVQPKGHLHANSRLSEADIREIRRAYAAKEGSTCSLAPIFGTSQRVIWLVVNNRTYKNVT